MQSVFTPYCPAWATRAIPASVYKPDVLPNSLPVRAADADLLAMLRTMTIIMRAAPMHFQHFSDCSVAHAEPAGGRARRGLAGDAAHGDHHARGHHGIENLTS